ncbi:MAG: hypothetical protein JWP84_4220 [Tardiphaga sp.]|nr:hypothetical protein [Tardiphaga sp.]
MTIPLDAGPRLAPQSLATSKTSALLPWLAMVALFVVAILLRHVLAANTDVSWLLTVGERVLDGQRLYVDVIETNPPMAALVYIPGIVVARALGLPAEIVTDGLVFAAIFVSLAIVSRILRNSAVLNGVQGWPLMLLAFAILAILPTQAFGQREHIALIALLPMLAVMAVRINRGVPPLWAVVVAGIGAGVALSFKPHFAIGLLCGVAALAIYTRSWRVLFKPENVIAAAAVGLYLAGVIVLFPEFFTVIGPLVRDVYIPVGISPLALLEKPAVSLWLIAMLAAYLLKRRSGIDATLVLLLATSSGFAVVFFLQRKGWPYHSLPMIALALFGLGYVLTSHAPRARTDRMLGTGAIVLLVTLVARSMLWFDIAFDARPLQDSVARLGPHPVILAITGEPGLGHPLVRAVGGTWVSRQQGLWVAAYLEYMRRNGTLGSKRDAVLDAHADRERAMLAADIRKNPPTVVLVDDLTGTWSGWLAAHPDVADQLKDFRPVETINNVAILARRN